MPQECMLSRFYRQITNGNRGESMFFERTIGGLGTQLLMPKASKKSKKSKGNLIPIGIVVTTCSLRKTLRPTADATPATLPAGQQKKVETAWLQRVGKLSAHLPAMQFYAGRAFGLAAEAARLADAKLYVLSAGLGLVSARRHIPVYSLTVAEGHEDSVSERVFGEFDAAGWFSRILSNPHSDQWADAAKRNSGRILIALSRPYAAMVGESLSALPARTLGRLRIFGASLESVLPASLHPAVVPYDDRLNAILPGTRSDFSQRAMFHFVRSIAIKSGPDREADFAAVAAALGRLRFPDRPHRPRRTDDEILKLISRRLRSESGAAKMLAALRNDEGVACEQSRFGRLYRIAVAKRAKR
jgi:hypothetical protein